MSCLEAHTSGKQNKNVDVDTEYKRKSISVKTEHECDMLPERVESFVCDGNSVHTNTSLPRALAKANLNTVCKLVLDCFFTDLRSYVHFTLAIIHWYNQCLMSTASSFFSLFKVVVYASCCAS